MLNPCKPYLYYGKSFFLHNRLLYDMIIQVRILFQNLFVRRQKDMCQCNCQGPKSDLSLLEDVLKEYGGSSSNLITILQRAQNIYGYLPKDVMYCIAEKVGITPADVMGVATFYSQFRLTPIGKYLIMSCQGTACHVNGSERVTAAISEYLGIGNGETTEDGLFTLENVACLGCCSLAPVIMINGEAYGNLTPDSAVAVIKGIQEKEGK